MRTIGRGQRHVSSGYSRRYKPQAIGAKPGGFNILGAFKRFAGSILSGLKTVVVAAGNIAQKVLDAANAFPGLKKLLQVPVPIPFLGAISVHTLLKGVAITGRITEKMANAIEVYNNTGDWREAFKELPISDIVMFILSPILEMFKGVLAIARAGGAVPPDKLVKLANYLKAMVSKIPKPMRVAVLKRIESEIGITLPQELKDSIASI